LLRSSKAGGKQPSVPAHGKTIEEFRCVATTYPRAILDDKRSDRRN